jgi:type II restriction enzyme
MLADSDREGIDFFIEQDTKNQNKTTIKINSKVGKELSYKVSMPKHKSQMRELDRERLLFYVTFEGGKAYLNLSNFLELLNIQEVNF